MKNRFKKRTRSESIFDTAQLQIGFKTKAIKGAGYTVISQLISFGIQTIGAIVLARLLGPDKFGLVAMVLVFIMLIQNFGLNGFTEAVVQCDDLNHHKMSKLFWVNLLIMITFMLFFIILAPFVAWFYKEPQLKNICIVMSLSIFFGGLRTCHFALLSRNMMFHLTSLMNMLAGLFSTVFAIAAAIKGLGYWALVIRQVTLPLFAAVFAWLFCQWRPGIPAKKTDIKSLLLFGFRTYGTFLVDYFRRGAVGMIVGKTFGKAPLGHYDRANQLGGVFTQITSMLTGVGVATLSRLRNDPTRYLKYLTQSLSVLAFFSFPFSFLVTLIGKDIIVLLLGTQWTKAGDLVTVLGPALGLVVLYDVNIWINLSLGRPDRLLKWGIIVLIISVLFILGGSIFGLTGVAAAQSVLYYILLFPSFVFAGRPLRIRAIYFLSKLWKYWSAAILSGFLYWLFFHGIEPIASLFHRMAPIFSISLGIFLYSSIYLLLILILFKGAEPMLLLIASVKEMRYQ